METLQDLQIGVPPISPPAPALNWKPYIVATDVAVYLWATVWHQISKVYRELLTGSQGGCDLSHVDAIFEIVARIGSNCGSAQSCTKPFASPSPRSLILPRVIPFMVRLLGSRMLRRGREFVEGVGCGTVLNNFSVFVPCKSPTQTAFLHVPSQPIG